jgi:hypothetical protein
MMSDDFANEDERIRGYLVKMDDAFCEAMFKAIRAGVERAPMLDSLQAAGLFR